MPAIEEKGGFSVPLNTISEDSAGMKVLKGTMGVVSVIKIGVRVVTSPSD